jgi:threonine synthase
MKALSTGHIKKHESATIIVTGNGLKDTVSGQLAIKGPIRIKPDLSLLIEIMNHKTEEVQQ